MGGMGKMRMFGASEIREADAGNIIFGINQTQAQAHFLIVYGFLFDIPMPAFAPAETDRTARRDDVAVDFIIGHRFPFGVVFLT